MIQVLISNIFYNFKVHFITLEERAIIKQNILIVLSPKECPEQLCSILINRGMATTVVQDVQTAFEILKSHNAAFLLLDLDLDGAIPFLEKVVETFYDPPPYILAADAFPCSLSQAEMLNLGADACVEKPLDLEEVLAIINAVLRRAERLVRPGPLHTSPAVEHEGLFIDPLRRLVSMDGQEVSLTVKEFDILYFLFRYPGIVFSKEQIYEQVWNEDYRYATTSVSDLISSLRKKLGLNARDNRYIQTIYGAGYRFNKSE